MRRVLSGETPEEVLGYPLDARHLAVVAWGRRSMESTQLLAWELSGQLLAVEVDDATAWGWVGFSNGPESGVRRGLRRYTPLAGAVAIGALARGADGFRESHLQALAAERVAQVSGAAVTFYDDVALESLALQDVGAARQFVRHALGELATPDVRARELRATLRAYLAAGLNGSSAGAVLGVHERTVANRLRAIEDRLERPVASAHAELELALRLHELLVGR